MHTKGVTRQSGPTDSWRRYMGHFVVKRYLDCVKYLGYYDAVGVDFCEGPFEHFSGNFFWTKSEYVRKLPNLALNLDLTNDRLYAEKWIGQGKGKFRGLMHCARLLYKVPIEEWEYVNRRV